MTDTGRALAPELLERAARLGSATVHEAAGRIGALPAMIRPVDPSWRDRRTRPAPWSPRPATTSPSTTPSTPPNPATILVVSDR